MTGQKLNKIVEKALKRLGWGWFFDADLWHAKEQFQNYKVRDIINELRKNIYNEGENTKSWLTLRNKKGIGVWYSEFIVPAKNNKE